MKICQRESTRTHRYRYKSGFIPGQKHWLNLLTLLVALCSYFTSSSLSATSTLVAADTVFRFQSKMAQRGHVASQYALAYMYESGQGTDKDLTMATDWYRQAAQKGFAPARDRLVYIDILNNGYRPQHQHQWLLKLKQTADDYNHAHQGESAFLLGQLYAAGLAVNKSLTMALKYLHLADAANVIGSDSEIRRVEAELEALREIYASPDTDTSQNTRQTGKSPASNKTTGTLKKPQATDRPAEVKANKPAAKQSNQAVSNRAEPVPPQAVRQHKPADKPRTTANPVAAKNKQTTPATAEAYSDPSAAHNTSAEQQELHPMQVICSGWQRQNSACR